MKTKLLFFGLILIVLTSCSPPYILPQPDYSWPEMASSKIGDSLGIYIPPENLYLTYVSKNQDPCCDHKDIKLGQAAFKAINSSSQAVFSNVIMLGEKPSDTYIKSLNLRGLLHVKDISIAVEFIPHIDNHINSDKIDQYDVVLTLNMNFSAIDFLLSDIREFNLKITTNSDDSISERSVNGLLKKLSQTALEQMADQLAHKLITIYGART